MIDWEGDHVFIGQGATYRPVSNVSFTRRYETCPEDAAKQPFRVLVCSMCRQAFCPLAGMHILLAKSRGYQ